ncbi:MmcQ/YjbR family DNA-binding protein [Nakamurella sp. YIM 132084]|uniref:MmcQ/YjbR family DNA-binding protein n=1 Tax=Nakamurella leprariae TaxID=2803911 RepID=A0A939BYS0_9ACTN|nr:MmcQ/YjbR family DNA-binding protein [Nakamurella leprariae]
MHATAARRATELLDVTRSFPFGPDTEAFKVRERIFLMTGRLTGSPILTMKCDPLQGESLRAELAVITPGHHMNKRHWISVAAGPGVTAELIDELVTDAYLLVVGALPRARRPALPDELARLVRRPGS